MVFVGFSPTFDTDPDPGKLYTSGGSGPATLRECKQKHYNAHNNHSIT